MGKEGELWDDSALIKAFDDAMSKYKKMHGKNKSSDVEKVTSSGEANSSACDDRNQEPIREIKDTNNTISITKIETRVDENLVPVKEDPSVDSCAPEPRIDSSNGLATQDEVKDYTSSQDAEGYNQLLSQYYELEEKMQLILQQLHQSKGWSYQYSGEDSASGAQYGTFATTREHPVAANQESHPPVVCSCCPYGCQYLVAPCTYPACSLGGTCTGNTCSGTSASVNSQMSPSLANTDIIRTAMGAAEKAISLMKTAVSANPDINDGTEIKDKNGSTSSETDLSAVLNAWYSAGFYTGKYLTEQSMAKKRDG